MSRDENQRWKEKYLANIEQQERLESRWEARIDLLRRGLVRSSLAAEGSDKAVDQCMQELRELLRRNDIDAGLSRLIPRLEKTVLDSEQRRQQRIRQNVTALQQIAQQLLGLDLPRDVRLPLKLFARDLEARASQSRELPVLLGELGNLQRRVLDQLAAGPEAQRPGLLQRLFGGRDDEEDSATAPAEPVAEAQPAPAAPAADAVVEAPASAETAPVSAPVQEESAPAVLETWSAPPGEAPQRPAAALDSLPLPAGLIPSSPRPVLLDVEGDQQYALPPMPEPGYSAVAPHIEASLLHLLDELQLPTSHRTQAEALRERINGSLNWYELVPVLDDLAVLVLALNDSGQEAFEGYLVQLNERLSTFLASLGSVQQGQSDAADGARRLDDELRDHVSDLQSSVQQATDLESLKRSVDGRLEGLLGSIERHRQEREAREHEAGERLQELVARVASMEEEARSAQASIEDQRQKALTDPLTGLPNRAALSERLELEAARVQRFGGDLVLAVLDVDHFKRINDDFGHLAGDKVLKIIAGELAKRMRKTDFIARFGGEEFVVLLPSTGMDGGRQMIESLRAAVEKIPFHFKGEPLTITCSAGLAQLREGERNEAAFERADQALYRAKRGGRNRLELG
ncbi:GGDEF domain-containing protein [Pseudomonas citronellolis]|uniref:GGDEF domain-containing protein n=1 Tax=Pseudomonas citronellolis TaxID=53408 RepID=UPI0023E39853|nr:GGDEF domain-containing protein [Pseudomonas citronellolis]MDF3931542.1 diguanylate cyclase [Pseudomonas citronellolis]